MDNYKIPTNVKQVGNVDENLRIYMEDYVYSYLLQYSKANAGEESIAMLIGRCMIIDGQKVLFVSGAIQGLHTETKKGILNFTNESYEYVEEQRLKHFKGLEIVGWMLSQPGYGTYLSTAHINYHIDNFKKPYQVMFVLDTIEKMNTFFQYSKDDMEIREMDGFFVFYDKNQEMHEYILENKVETKIEEETKQKIKTRKIEEIEEVEESIEPSAVTIDENKDEEIKPINIINLDNIKKVKKNSKKKQKMNLQFIQNNQLFVGGVVIAFIMLISINIVESGNKITKLENDVNVLTEAYNLLVTHVNNSDNVSQVFASNDVQVSDQTETEQANETATEPTYIEEMPIENETKTDNELETEAQISETIDEAEVSIIEESDVESESIVNTDSEQTQEVTKLEKYYTVKQGDSLISISRNIYGNESMQQEIMDANGIEDPNKIYFGMKLLLP